MVFIVKVPGINGLGKTQGCENAGNEIIRSIKEIHSNEKGVPIDTSLFDLEEIHLDNFNLELTNKLIYKNSYEAYEDKPKTIFLGGDHSISYSLVKSLYDYCRKEEKEPCLIVFDAHPDLMPAMNEPTHEEWLRKLIDEGFPAKNILLVGVRNSDREEIKFMNEKKIQKISVNSIIEDIQNIADTITEFANSRETYVSIDIDVTDPAFAPATGYSEPGGISSRDFIYLIQRINKIKNLKGVDIVEINPTKKGGEETVKLGAKILSELI
ncbi:MAG: arginase family protein [Candidatus Pacearchaeota archaeon]|jgi:arginase family enzyme